MGKELVFKALRHEDITEVPWVPFAGVHAGALKGYNAEEMLKDADKIVDSLKEVAKLYNPDGMPIIFDLLQDEGLCMGGSTGINIAGAVRMARDLGPGHTIVTILCDYGTRYQSKLFNPMFLREKGLPVPDWLDRGPRDIPEVYVDA